MLQKINSRFFSRESFASAPPWIKIFLCLAVFDFVGFIVFIITFALSSQGIVLDRPFALAITYFLTVWGILFAFTIPLSIIAYGLWGILYHETAFRSPMLYTTRLYKRTMYFKGGFATLAGVFWLIYGCVLLWGVNGVVVSFFCSAYPVCPVLPSLLRFF